MRVIRPTFMSLAMLLTTVAGQACFGQPLQHDELPKSTSELRMKVMKQRVASLRTLGPTGKECKFDGFSLFRYNDAVRRVSDASLWKIGEAGRPYGILVLEIYDGTRIQFEMTAAAEKPQSVEGGGWKWEPQTNDFSWSEIPKIPIPPADAKRGVRRRQIAEIARKFEAKEEHRGKTYQLRLLPQPILWYEDKTKNVVDGAVFVWAHGTNAEIIMFIELQDKGDADATWMAGFSRLGAAKLEVSFESEPFWSKPMNRGNKQRPYFYRALPLTGDEQAAFKTE